MLGAQYHRLPHTLKRVTWKKERIAHNLIQQMTTLPTLFQGVRTRCPFQHNPFYVSMTMNAQRPKETKTLFPKPTASLNRQACKSVLRNSIPFCSIQQSLSLLQDCVSATSKSVTIPKQHVSLNKIPQEESLGVSNLSTVGKNIFHTVFMQ